MAPSAHAACCRTPLLLSERASHEAVHRALIVDRAERPRRLLADAIDAVVERADERGHGGRCRRWLPSAQAACSRVRSSVSDSAAVSGRRPLSNRRCAPSAHAACRRTRESSSFSAPVSAGTALESSSAPSAHAACSRTPGSRSFSVSTSGDDGALIVERAERPRGVATRRSTSARAARSSPAEMRACRSRRAPPAACSPGARLVVGTAAPPVAARRRTAAPAPQSASSATAAESPRPHRRRARAARTPRARARPDRTRSSWAISSLTGRAACESRYGAGASVTIPMTTRVAARIAATAPAGRHPACAVRGSDWDSGSGSDWGVDAGADAGEGARRRCGGRDRRHR